MAKIERQALWVAAMVTMASACAGRATEPVEASAAVASVMVPVSVGSVSNAVASGLRLVYGIGAGEAHTVEQVRYAVDVFDRRLNRIGIKHNVRMRGDEILVEVPGMEASQMTEVKEYLGRRGKLEFRMVDNADDVIGRGPVIESSDVEIATESMGGVQGHYAMAARRQGETGEQGRRRLANALRSVRVPEGRELLFGEGRDGWRSYLVYKHAEVANDEIAATEAQRDESSGQWSVSLRLTAEGASRFEGLTAANVRKRLAIVLDGKVESAPIIMSPIRGGRLTITLGHEVARKEAVALADVLGAGALPFSVVLMVEEQFR